MVCPNCGASNDSTAAFCFNCGERLEQAPAPVGSPTIRIPPGDSAGAPTISIPPGGSAGSPTIRIPPGDNPFLPPAISPPPPSPPTNLYSTQQFDIPAANPPFVVPAPQPPASPYSTSPLGAPTVVPNSTAAIISLVFGIVSWFALPIIGAIVAVVAGHMARNEIRRSNGAIGGSGMATAGLVLGYAHLAVFLIGICLFLVFVVGIGLSAAR